MAVGYAEGGIASDQDILRGARTPLGQATGLFTSLASRNAGIRASFVTFGASGTVHSTDVGVSVLWTGVANVAEDPAVADGLRIGDLRLQIGLGRRLAHGRLGVALSAGRTWSTIFGTTGSTLSVGGAVCGALGAHLRLVAAVEGVGPPTVYRNAAASASRRSQQPTIQVGVRWRPSVRRPLNVYVDLRDRAGDDGATALIVAGDWSIRDVLVLRAGLRTQQPAGTADRVETTPAAGARVRFGSFALDYGFAGAGVDYDLLPQHHFLLAWVR